MSYTVQERLDIAWQNQDIDLETLATKLGIKPTSAQNYRRMIELGVRQCRALDESAWHEFRTALDAGAELTTLALSAGYPPGSLSCWMRLNKPHQVSLSQQALRIPFTQFPELFGGRSA